MAKFKDLTGKTINRITFIGISHRNKHKRIVWKVQCYCGNQFICVANNIKNGGTKSCGCFYKKPIKHGCSISENGLPNRIYRTWANMKTRCANKKSSYFYLYGGRGITVCERWNKFENFLKDNKRKYEVAYKKYGKETQLDRIDNNGDYCPKNCRWVSRTINCNNKRNNRLFTYKNKIYTLSEITSKFKIDPETFTSRLKVGIPLEQALTIPLRKRELLSFYKSNAS